MNAQETALARHHGYALLGRLAREGVTEALWPTLLAVPELAAALPAALDPDEAAAAHHHLFSFNLFPYESFFLDATGLLGGPLTAQVARRYAEAGVALAAHTEADHLGHELAFLAFLCGAEADAWADGLPAVAAQMRQRQADFLTVHLLRWLAPLVVALQREAPPPYRAVAGLLLALVDDHARGLGVGSATPTNGLPTAPALLDDERTGLREIAAWLVAPPWSGWVLSRDAIGGLARRLALPRGFDSRARLLENLFRAAAQFDQWTALLAAMDALAADWSVAYEALARDAPALGPHAAPWQARLAETRHLLAGLRALS